MYIIIVIFLTLFCAGIAWLISLQQQDDQLLKLCQNNIERIIAYYDKDILQDKLTKKQQQIKTLQVLNRNIIETIKQNNKIYDYNMNVMQYRIDSLQEKISLLLCKMEQKPTCRLRHRI
jgi:hypothetical protein